MVIITNFIKPEIQKKIPQKKIIEYLIKEIEKENTFKKQDIQNAFQKYSIPQEKIKSRNLFCYNFENEIKRKKSSLFEIKNDHNEKIYLAEEIMMSSFEEIYKNTNKIPDEIYFSTSIEFGIPSPMQKFVSKKNWINTKIYHSNFFGCAGPFPTTRLGINSLNSTNLEKKIDIMNIELISTYTENILNKLKTTLSPLEIIKSTLFSDGAILYSLENENYSNKKGLKIIDTYTKMIPNTSQIVTWMPNDKYFDLEISKELPEIIKKEIKKYTNEILQKNQLHQKEVILAIHPGGSKILDNIKEELNLTYNDLKYSYKSLFENGNMSSISCPTIWKEILEDESVPQNKKILTIGIGPGIILEGMILEKK